MAPLEPDVRKIFEEYLLGRVSADQADALEARCFEDDAFHEGLEFTEEMLIRGYLHGSLSPKDRLAFETVYLRSGEHRRKTEAQRHLMAAIDRSQPAVRLNALLQFFLRRDPFPRWAFAVAALAIAVPAVAISMRMRNLQHELGASRRAGEERLLLAQAATNAAENRLNDVSTVHFELTPGVTRYAGAAVLRIPPGEGFVSFEFAADATVEASSGRISFQNAAGSTVSSQALGVFRIGPAGGLKVRLPRQALADGTYDVSLESAGRVEARYSFTINRR